MIFFQQSFVDCFPLTIQLNGIRIASSFHHGPNTILIPALELGSPDRRVAIEIHGNQHFISYSKLFASVVDISVIAHVLDILRTIAFGSLPDAKVDAKLKVSNA